MNRGTIHDHDVALVQGRAEVLAENVQEDVTGDVSVDEAQCADTIECDGSDEVEASTPRWTLDDRCDPTWSPTIPPALCDAHASFVEEDELAGVEPRLALDEVLPRFDHIGPVCRPPPEAPLFRVYPRRLSVSDIV